MDMKLLRGGFLLFILFLFLEIKFHHIEHLNVVEHSHCTICILVVNTQQIIDAEYVFIPELILLYIDQLRIEKISRRLIPDIVALNHSRAPPVPFAITVV